MVEGVFLFLVAGSFSWPMCVNNQLVASSEMMSIISDFGTRKLVSHIEHLIGSTGYLDWKSASLPI